MAPRHGSIWRGQYNTARYVVVQNTAVVAIYVLTFLGMISFFLIYQIGILGGYQADIPVYGRIHVAIEGMANVASPDGPDMDPQMLMDSYDLAHQFGPGEVFLITAVGKAGGAMSGSVVHQEIDYHCPGNARTEPCDSDRDCRRFEFIRNHGYYNGKCGENRRCELMGWCPLLDYEAEKHVIRGFEQLHISVFGVALFERWELHREISHPAWSSLQSLQDKKGKSRFKYLWPSFTIADLLNSTCGTTKCGVNVDDPKSINSLASNGAVLIITLDWDCNFDRAGDCQPTWHTRRMDNVGGKNRGFMRADVKYHSSSDKSRRNVVQETGILFKFIQKGKGRRFDLGALTLNIGAFIGYVSLAWIITECVLDYCLSRSSKEFDSIMKAKYKSIETVASGTVLDNIAGMGDLPEMTSPYIMEDSAVELETMSDDLGIDSANDTYAKRWNRRPGSYSATNKEWEHDWKSNAPRRRRNPNAGVPKARMPKMAMDYIREQFEADVARENALYDEKRL